VSEPVKICMVGAGRVGKNHTNSLVRHVPGARVVALVDPVVDVRDALADQYGIIAGFNSLEEAIDRASFDAVVITTPTFTHKALAVEAAAHGKHIFLEKPMALNLGECDEIITAARQAGVHLQIGFMRRFDPEFTAVAQRIEAGEIGRPMMIKSLTHGPGLPPAWARDISISNGMLAEVNSHDWDSTRWLMGSNYDRVYTEIANFKGQANNISTPHFYDNVLVDLRFESGGLGMITGICPCGYGYDARVEIYGEKGVMFIGSLQGQHILSATNRETGIIQPVFRTWPERFAWAYIYEMEHFVECVQKDREPRVGGEEGRWAVAGVLAGTLSFLEERPVYLKEILESNDRVPWQSP
jgi:predicted dehydrogenase